MASLVSDFKVIVYNDLGMGGLRVHIQKKNFIKNVDNRIQCSPPKTISTKYFPNYVPVKMALDDYSSLGFGYC